MKEAMWPLGEIKMKLLVGLASVLVLLFSSSLKAGDVAVCDRLAKRAGIDPPKVMIDSFPSTKQVKVERDICEIAGVRLRKETAMASFGPQGVVIALTGQVDVGSASEIEKKLGPPTSRSVSEGSTLGAPIEMVWELKDGTVSYVERRVFWVFSPNVGDITWRAH